MEQESIEKLPRWARAAARACHSAVGASTRGVPMDLSACTIEELCELYIEESEPLLGMIREEFARRNFDIDLMGFGEDDDDDDASSGTPHLSARDRLADRRRDRAPQTWPEIGKNGLARGARGRTRASRTRRR